MRLLSVLFFILTHFGRLLLAEKQCEQRKDGQVYVYHIQDTLSCKDYCGAESKEPLETVPKHCLECCPDLFRNQASTVAAVTEAAGQNDVYQALSLCALFIIVVMTVVIAYLLREKIKDFFGGYMGRFNRPAAGPERDPESGDRGHTDEFDADQHRRDSSGISSGGVATENNPPLSASVPSLAAM